MHSIWSNQDGDDLNFAFFNANYGTGWLNGIEIPAGETFRFSVNFDWNRPEIVKDWSFTAWGTKSKVEVRHSEGIESKSLPFITKQGGSTQPEETEPEAVQPEPTVPEPTEPEVVQPEPAVPEPAEPITEETDAGESGEAQPASQCNLDEWCVNLAGDDDWDCCPTADELTHCDPNDICMGYDLEFYEECCYFGI